MTKRLCPDIDKIKDFLKVKNGYSNRDRSSFSVEISICNQNECESHEKIQAMLDEMMFTLYYLNEDIEYASVENQGEITMVMSDMFLSQFTLNVDQYRDNNNFLILNKLNAAEGRYTPLVPQTHITKKFFQLRSRPPWTGKRKAQIYSASFDNG